MLVPLPIAKLAVRQLANADYTIATKISHDVAIFVPWALDRNYYGLADFAVNLLQQLDALGNLWIQIACWLVVNSH